MSAKTCSCGHPAAMHHWNNQGGCLVKLERDDNGTPIFCDCTLTEEQVLEGYESPVRPVKDSAEITIRIVVEVPGA